MPYVNPNKMKNQSMPTVKNKSVPRQNGPVPQQPKPKVVGPPKPPLTAPDQAGMDKLGGVQDPAERYKMALGMLGQQVGNRQGNIGLHFNQGQQDWLQSLNPQDQMKELIAAFGRQRPNFGHQPLHPPGPPSPVGPQPMIPDESHQAPPGVQVSNPYQSDQPGMYHGVPYSQIPAMPMPQVNLQQLLSGSGVGMLGGGPSVSGAGVPSPIGGGMQSMNGGGYQAPPQMSNPYQMGNMNGGGYQAPPSNQNPFMLSLIEMLRRGQNTGR